MPIYLEHLVVVQIYAYFMQTFSDVVYIAFAIPFSLAIMITVSSARY